MSELWKSYIVDGREHPGVLISGLEESGGTNLQAKILPNGYTNLHTHSGTETITVISGQGKLIRDGIELVLMPGSEEMIPPHISHSVMNTGEADLELRARFNPKFYEQETILIAIQDT